MLISWDVCEVNILDLHVQELHQSRKGPNVEQQKDVVSHPVLHLRFTAAFGKRPWRAEVTLYKRATCAAKGDDVTVD